MSKQLRVPLKVLDLLIIFMMVFSAPVGVFAAPSSTGATIASDLADYNPGGTVTLTGAGWASGEVVHIVVNDTIGQTWQHTADITADGSGNLKDVFNLPNYFVSDYDVTATGPTSGSATTTFTDANPSANLDQCANDPAPSPSSDGCSANATDWVNGNLGGSKSFYLEGDSIPYRLLFDNLSLSSHTVTIEWDTTKSSTHALDYLTTYNQSVTTANPCLGVSGCSTSTTFAIPADPQVTGAGVTPIAGNFTLFGGTITGVSAYSYADGTGFSGDKSARITITFTASVVNPVLAWGGHISTRKDWGANNSAVAISGSPYHTRLIDLDGSGGNQDRSLSADAVVFPGSITIIKDATPNGPTSFGFTGSPAPLTNFSLVDDGTSANTKVFSNIINFQTYTVNESTIPSGWGFDSVSCSVTTPNGGSYTTSTTTVNINMAEGENWTCTYLDSQRTGSLTVIKHVVNDNGGTATAGQWSLHVKSGANEVSGSPQAGSESGTTYTLNAGTYTVSETSGPSGYTFTGFSGDCDASGNVTVVAGQTKTCTLTNNDQPAHLKLVKTVTNDNGGTAVATDFTLSAAGPTSLSGAGGAESDVNAGTYTLSETNLPGYAAGSWSCTGGTFSSPDKIALANGQSATCTINNDDQTAHLKLVKTVTNDNGGTAKTTDFTLSAAGPTPLSGAGGAESNVNPGTYTLSETNLPIYTAGSWSCTGGTFTAPDQIALTLGQSATCTINNNDNAPALHLRKIVVNDNGGTATATDWTLSATGPTSLSGNTPVDSGSGFQAGTYALSEAGPTGYTASNWVCVGGTQSGSNITVGLGESATCTITNDDNAAHLKLVKTVTNDNGGTAKTTDFTLSAAGPTPLSGAGGAESDVSAGTYTLSETNLPGYTAGAWSCTGGTFTAPNKIALALGQSATCTINNDDQSAHLTLVKVVVNDNGGTAKTTDFTLSAAGPTPISGAGGVSSDVNAGAYTLSETGPTGYSTTGYDCGSSVTLALGESKTCTITNNDIPPKLHLRKVVVNNNGGTATVANFTLTADGTGSNDLSGTSPVDSGAGLQADTWALSETTAAGYTGSAWNCVGGTQNGSNITVGIGGEATCTVTNDDQTAHLKLVKIVTNDNGGTAKTTDFTLSAAGPTPLSGAGGAESDVNAGTYTLSETNLPGYTAGSWSCSGGTFTSPDKIALALGQSATCTINNNDNTAHLKLVKTVTNDNGGTAVATDFTLSAAGPTPLSGAGGAESDVNAGTYNLSETTLAGYAAGSWSCVGGTQNGSSVSLALGQSATCTITNNDIAPALHLRKVVVNNNGGTAVATDWTLSASGPTPLSGTTPVDSGAGFSAGTYALSESGPTGYSASAWNCQGGTQNGSNITVGLGESATCTITNDDLAPSLTLVKVVLNNNGGTATPADFNLIATGPGSASETLVEQLSINSAQNTPTTSVNSLQSGRIYRIEVSGIYFNGSSFNADAECRTGDNWATAQEPGPGLEVMAVYGSPIGKPYLNSAQGITAQDLNWGPCAANHVYSHILSGNGGKIGFVVSDEFWGDPGIYCSSQYCQNNGTSDNSGTLTVKIYQENGSSFSGPGPSVSSGSNFSAGTYSLSENGPTGYSASAWVCADGQQSGSNITVGLGESATCTITNDDQPASLTLVKHVINNNGGSALASAWTLHAGSNAVAGSESGTLATNQAGTYALSETGGPAGYSASAWVCAGGQQSGSNITVGLGESVTCTITNNDIAPKLHLRKVVVNDNGGSAVVTDFTLTANGTGPNDLSGTSPVDSGAGLQADTWTLSETGPAGYAASAWSCVGGTQSGSNITVGIGGEATCTITNDDIAPKLHLRKVVVNDNGGTKTTADFTLTANGTGSNDLAGTSPVDSGAGLQADTWALSETNVYGYSASAWNCVGGTQNGSNITVGIGGEATCTITNNDQPGTIVIIKNAKPAQGSFAFTTTGTGYNGFTLTGATTNNGNKNTQTLNAGTYTVKEATQLGWTLTGIGGSTDPNTPYACVVTGSGGSTGSGDLNTQTATISLKNGDTVTCTFENTGNGATRTQGFWATHPQLAKLAWDGGSGFGHTFPGVVATTGIGDQLICGRLVDSTMLAGQSELMGGFWADVSKTSTSAKRSALDQARMQLLQQLLAAELNASAFGSVPSGGTGMFAQWESALCGTNQTAIKNAQQQAASFNTNGDSSTFTPGTSADSKNARLYANIPFWDIIKP